MATKKKEIQRAKTFEVVKDPAGRGWRLSIPAKLSDTGKRRQFFYPTSREADAAAKKWKDQRREFGAQSLAISPSLADTATAAEILLAPLGIGLLEAVRRFVETETRLRSSVTVAEACRQFREHGTDWSDSQAGAYRLRCDKLCTAFPDRLLSSVTGAEIAAHLSATTNTASVRNQAVRLVRAIWRWCAKPPRQWCQPEPVEHLEIKKTTAAEIGLLTPDQAPPSCVPLKPISPTPCRRSLSLYSLDSAKPRLTGSK